MAQFRIPGPLRRLSDGQVTVPVEASDLASAFPAIDQLATILAQAERDCGPW